MTLHRQPISIALSGGLWLLTGLLYRKLPDPIPTHFNLAGQADGFAPKPWGVLIFPIMTTVVLLVFALIPTPPQSDPQDERPQILSRLSAAVVMMLVAVSVAVYLVALGQPVPMSKLIPSLLGLLLIAIGNVLGTVGRNRWVGIRTPWTLNDPENWRKTHRLGSKVFVAVGGFLTVAAWMGASWLLLPAVVTVAGVPVAYSYWLTRHKTIE